MQSWFASVVYAGAERIGGLEAVRLQFTLTAGVLAGLAWLLTRPAGDLIRRTVAVLPFIAVAALGWSHRPYVVGLICLALVLLVADGRLDPRWLIPTGWLWLNTHGGWPLGLVALTTLYVGARFDRRDGRVELRSFGWLSVGLVVGSFNPYGVKLLLFPFSAVERREAFQRIVEWRAPTFTGRDELAFLVALALAIVALHMGGNWRRTLPMIVFVSAALISARNIHVAALVLLPGTAEGLRRQAAGDFDSFRVPIAAIASVLAVVTLTSSVLGDAFGDEPYPVAATEYLEAEGLDPTEATVVAMDYVGNYWEARYGHAAAVFVDDRVEVFPLDVLDDYEALAAGERRWEEALSRYAPDAVVWERDEPLAALLAADDDWVIVHEDEKFLVAVPT